MRGVNRADHDEKDKWYLHPMLRKSRIQLTHLTEHMERGFTEAASDRDRAGAIFGRLLVPGYDATDQAANHLQEARRLGVISDREYQEVLAADLLWGGQ